MNQNKLNVYDDNESFKDEYKFIIKPAIIVFFVIAILLSILIIIFPSTYPLIIGYASGSIVAIVLFYVAHRILKNTNYLDYKRVTKKIHFIYQITYILTFIILVLIFPNVAMAIGIAIGLMILKIASLFSNLAIKKTK